MEGGEYRVAHVVEGDSVTEVLGYVQYQKQNLVQRVRQASEEALRRGLLTFEESALLIRRFDEGLSGYTYLEEETPSPAGNGSNGLGDSKKLARPESPADRADATRGEPPTAAGAAAAREKRPLPRG
jgi:hypothetical protein